MMSTTTNVLPVTLAGDTADGEATPEPTKMTITMVETVETTITNTNKFKVADLSLAEQGRRRIQWAEARMPVLMKLREQYRTSQPLRGMRIAGCLHVTKETAVLVRTLAAAGAQLAWSGCNPLSTQDDVAAALAAEGHSIFAWHGQSVDDFYWSIDRTLEFQPTLTLDDGADLIFRVHSTRPDLIPGLLGGTEETTR